MSFFDVWSRVLSAPGIIEINSQNSQNPQSEGKKDNFANIANKFQEKKFENALLKDGGQCAKLQTPESARHEVTAMPSDHKTFCTAYYEGCFTCQGYRKNSLRFCDRHNRQANKRKSLS